MYYTQFYEKGHVSGDLIEACGDRSVIIIDGRESMETMCAFSKEHAKKRGFKAFRIMRGESFTRSSPFANMPIIEV